MRKLINYFFGNPPLMLLLGFVMFIAGMLIRDISNKKIPDCEPYGWALIPVFLVLVLILSGLGYLSGRIDQMRHENRNRVREYHNEREQ